MKTKRHLNRKILILVTIIVVAIGTAVGYYAVKRSNNSKLGSSNTANTINYGPATEQEKSESNQTKDRELNEPNQPTQTQSTTSTDAKRTLKPIITGAAQYDQAIEFTAYIPNALEGGQCTFTITKGAAKVTKVVQGTKENSTSYCPLVSVPVSELSGGIWSVTLQYDSSTSAGTSDAKSFEVKQ